MYVCMYVLYNTTLGTKNPQPKLNNVSTQQQQQQQKKKKKKGEIDLSSFKCAQFVPQIFEMSNISPSINFR